MRADQILAKAANEYGHRPALITGRSTHSFAELNRKADRLAAALRTHGVGRGSHVVALLDDGFPAVVTLFGVLRAGGILCPVAPSTRAPVLARVLAASGAVGIVTESRLASVAAAALGEVPAVRLVIVAGADRSAVTSGCLSFSEVVGTLSDTVSVPGVAVDEAAVVFPVHSGADDVPGFDVLTHGAFAAIEAAADAETGEGGSARPFASRAGLAGFVAALRAGVPMVLHVAGDGRRPPVPSAGFTDVRLALA